MKKEMFKKVKDRVIECVNLTLSIVFDILEEKVITKMDESEKEAKKENSEN